MNKDTWQALGCLIGVFVMFPLLIGTCTHSISKGEQHTKDSIDSVHNSPEYKAYCDSLDQARDMEQIEREKNTIVIICKGDSNYHYSSECSNIHGINGLSFDTEYTAKELGKTLCAECNEWDIIYRSWIDGDLKYIDED